MSSATAFYNTADQVTDSLFDLLENALDNSSEFVDISKPRQILGESVFNQFVKSEELNNEFPLGLDKLDIPELSPSVGTITPFQLHSVSVESIFSPNMESTPLFEDIDSDSSKWEPLFAPSEMDIPDVVRSISQQAPTQVPTQAQAPSTELFTQAVISSSPTIGSPNFITTEVPTTKRSSSDAHLEVPTSKRSSSNVSINSVDSDGIVAYNRKQRQQELSPILTESGDPIAQKRARNTEAARRSRARKMERMSQLEDKVDSLKQKNADLEDEVARLRALLALR